MLRFLLGFETFFGAIEWRPELGTKVVLMSRDGGAPVRLETDACMAGHVVAAWDEGEDLVVDMCQLENWSQMGDCAANFRTSDWGGLGASSVWRYRITPASGKVRGEKICDMPAEFPGINPIAECRGARWAYFASNRAPGEGGLFRGVLKLDCRTGAGDYYDFGETKVSLQPTFVPRPAAAAEDDGWIMTVVHDASTRTTQIPILDARAIADGPVCTLHLHENMGTTFHGCWIPA
jgi:all-trans-8'-apo-beta-carotenal 15,15'-oxygenase